MADGIARTVLIQSHRAHVGHIGSCLSVADLLAVLYCGVMRVEDPADVDRDRFVLSKGHAALALYGALHLRGWLTDADLDSFCGDASLLGVHPEHALPGIDFSTGSLGQGLSFAVGAALAAHLERSDRRIFALLSDAECDEGATWEAAMFAAHHELENLIVLVDNNGQQALGFTREVLSLDPMAERWSAFGWDVHEAPGHDPKVLFRTIDGLSGDRPHVIVADTTFGRRVPYMEGQIRWHYLPMSDDEFELAMNGLHFDA